MDTDSYGLQADLLSQPLQRSMSQREQLAMLGLLSGDEALQQVGKVTLDLDARRQNAADARDAAHAEARLRENERAAAAAAQREWQAAQGGMQRSWQEQQREEQRAFQAAQNAAMRGVLAGNQPLVQTIDPQTGQPVFTPRTQAAGMQPAPPGGGQPSEDERKAAGWFDQATLGFANMRTAIAEDKTAAKPTYSEMGLGMIPKKGDDLAYAAMTPARQRFTTAASSFSEAVLRAATGAGVNKDEALQKVRELTPRFGEDESSVRMKQGMAQMYLQSLQTRAGRAASPSLLPKTRAAAAAAGGASGGDAPATDLPDPHGFRKALGLK